MADYFPLFMQDSIVHPAIVIDPHDLTSERAVKLLELFSTPEQVEELLNRVKPKLAVYTYYNTGTGLIACTRTTYSGAVEVRRGWMTIEFGDQIRIRRLTSKVCLGKSPSLDSWKASAGRFESQIVALGGWSCRTHGKAR